MKSTGRASASGRLNRSGIAGKGIRSFFALSTCILAQLVSLGAKAGPPFQTDDPEPAPYEHFEIDVFAQETRANNATDGSLPGIDFNYGIAPETELHLGASLASRSPHQGSRALGYGDTEVGLKYRFVDEDEEGWMPQIALSPEIEIPTGNARRELGDGHIKEFLPIWLQKQFGNWTTFGGGGYWLNPGPDAKNYWFFGYAIERKVTAHLSLGGEVFYQTRDSIYARDSAGFSFGGTYDLDDMNHLLFSAGRGVRQVPETNQFTYYVAYQLTF
jgi:hypothetical protein